MSGNCLLRFVCLSRFFSLCVFAAASICGNSSLCLGKSVRVALVSMTVMCDVSAVVMMRLGESPFPLLSLPSFFPLPVCT